jgi:hypothetical protein
MVTSKAAPNISGSVLAFGWGSVPIDQKDPDSAPRKQIWPKHIPVSGFILSKKDGVLLKSYVKLYVFCFAKDKLE